MTDVLLTTLALVLCIGAGTVGGVFFAFSTFVMQALAQLPVAGGVNAMQRINVVVLNPAFLGVFMGTAGVAAVGAALAVVTAGGASAALVLVAGVVYLLGSFAVTLVFNVPRNERLRRLEIDSAEAAAYWPEYVREWTRWNHVRTAASLLSAACAAGAIAA